MTDVQQTNAATSTATPTPDLILVEDNSDHAELMIDALASKSGSGFVFRFESGEDFLEYAKTISTTEAKRPKCVILDLKLPGIDGLEVLRRIRIQPDFAMIPVVVVSTSSSYQDITGAYEARANGYVVKPTRLSELESSMLAISNFWLEQNQTAY
jgi:DNA-binding response OmpR family regulator